MIWISRICRIYQASASTDRTAVSALGKRCAGDTPPTAAQIAATEVVTIQNALRLRSGHYSREFIFFRGKSKIRGIFRLAFHLSGAQ